MTRDEAINEWTFRSDHIKNWLDENGEEPSIRHYVELIDMAIEALSADVVRCKDCRWYDNRYGDVCHNPRYGDGWANYQPPYVDEDYWCKDGERKGGEAK